MDDNTRKTEQPQYITQSGSIQLIRCDVVNCSAYFTSYQEMIKHKALHANQLVARIASIPFSQPPQRDGKSHICGICNKGLSSRRCLREHMLRHTGEKPYSCNYPGCEKRFINELSVTEHTATHYDDRPFKCDFKIESADGKTVICNKRFKNGGQLRGHKIFHRKPSLSCSFSNCTYSTRRSRQMQVHLSKKHSEQLNSLGSILQVMPNTSQTD